jgi:hypothetical protein
LLPTDPAETEITNGALCCSEEDVPVNVAVVVAAAVPIAAESMTLTGIPGVSEIVCGEAVTPAGSPLI